MANQTNEQRYIVTLTADGCAHCAEGQQWSIHDTVEKVDIGQSWGGPEGKESAEDVCDLMNMAFDAGQESVQQTHGIATHRKWMTERAEWLKKERVNGGDWEYLLRKEEETRYCLEKFNAHLPALKDAQP